MKPVTKHYSNDELTIVWQNELCIHSTICWKNGTGLPEVFNPRERPWIKPMSAESQRIIEQVNKCPSGALSYFLNETKVEPEPLNESKAKPESLNETKPEPQSSSVQVENIIEVSPNGPLLVYGNVTIKHTDGTETQKNKVTALCRCGASGNKPYCDGSHTKIDFKG